MSSTSSSSRKRASGVSPRASAAREAARRRYQFEECSGPLLSRICFSKAQPGDEDDGNEYVGSEVEEFLLEEVGSSFRAAASSSLSRHSRWVDAAAPSGRGSAWDNTGPPDCSDVPGTYLGGNFTVPVTEPESAAVVPATASALGSLVPETATLKVEPTVEGGMEVPSSLKTAAISVAVAGARPEYDVSKGDEYLPCDPTYDKANSLSFAKLCYRLEKVWKQRKRQSNKQSRDEVSFCIILSIFLSFFRIFPLCI